MHQGTHISVADYRPFRVRCRECSGLLTGSRASKEPHPYLTKATRGKAAPHVSTYKCRICSGYLRQYREESTVLWS